MEAGRQALEKLRKGSSVRQFGRPRPLRIRHRRRRRKVRVANKNHEKSNIVISLFITICSERNRKRFYYSNGDNNAKQDDLKMICYHWTHEWR